MIFATVLKLILVNRKLKYVVLSLCTLVDILHLKKRTRLAHD
jgi:hypothetical protein